MATGNVVELVVELKTKGKENLANYSKELKSFSKLMEGVVKSSSKYAKNASNVEKANKKMANSQTAVNTQLKNNQKVLVSYNTSLDNNANKVKNASSSYSDFNANLKTINSTVKNVGGALAIVGTAAAASAVGLAVAIKSITELNKQMEVFARQGSMGVEEFKALAFATEQYGITADQVADKMKDFEDRVGEAAAAGTGVFLDVGDVLGYTDKQTQELAKSLQHLTGRDGFLELVRLMEDANVSAAKMTFALESVGNDMSRLIPLWKDGGKELERLEQRYKDMSEALALTTAEQKDMIVLTEQVGLTQKALSESAKKLTATFAKPLEEAFLAVQETVIAATESIIAFTNNKALKDGDVLAIGEINSENELLRLLDQAEADLEFAKIDFEKFVEGVNRTDLDGFDLEFYDSADESHTQALNNLKAIQEQLKKIQEQESKAQTGDLGSNLGAINKQQENTIQAIINRFKTEQELLDETYQKEVTLIQNRREKSLKEQERLNKALIADKEQHEKNLAAIEEKYSGLEDNKLNKKLYEDEKKKEKESYKIKVDGTKNVIAAQKKLYEDSQNTELHLDEEYEKKSAKITLKQFDQTILELQKKNAKIELQFSVGEIDIDEYERLINENLNQEKDARNAKAGYLSEPNGSDSIEYLTANNQVLKVDDDIRIANEKIAAIKRSQAEGTMEVLNAEIALAEASGDSAKAQDLRIRLFIEETKLRTDIDKLVKQELISQRVKLANQQKINDDIKKEQDFKLKLLEDQIEIAKAQDDEIKVIERQLALELEKIGYNEDYTKEQKEQLRLSAMAVANEEIRNEKLKEANKLLDEENKNRKKALEEIRDLELELADLKGISDEQSLREQKDAALKGIEADKSIPDEEKAKIKSLTGQIFDEKIIDAQFETLKTKYQQLLIDLGNASSLEDQIGISQEISKTVEQMGQIEGLDANQMRDLADATNEWNESLMGVNFTLQDFNNALVGGLTDAFMDIVSGTKDAGEAFQDMAFKIVESMLEIYAQQLLMQALGVDSGGNATGSGLFGAIGGMFGGAGGAGGFSFFHNGGSPSDAMVETRDVKSLQADETMAVIRKNETVMTKNEYNNVTQGSNKVPNINQQLVLDPTDIQRSIGKTDEFEQNIITVITAQQRQIRDILS